MNNTTIPPDGEEKLTSDLEDLLTPIAISMILYAVGSILYIIEYHSTLSQQSATTLPQQSSHSHLRMGDMDDVPSRTRNNMGGRRGARMDPSHVDIGESTPAAPPGEAKSPGEENRRLFYKYLMLSLILRLILLPIQRTYSDKPNNDVTITVSRSLPTLTSMIAYTILTFFYAQVVFMASGKVNNANTLKHFRQSLVQTIYGIYGSIIFFNSVIPTISNKWFDILVWGMLCLYHFSLLFSMSYFGFLLLSFLKTNLTGGLGLRLIGMGAICTMTFLLRSILEGLVIISTYMTANGLDGSNLVPLSLGDGKWNSVFGRDVVGYIILEWLPAMLILYILHRSNGGDNSNSNGAGTRSRNGMGDDSASAMEGGQLYQNHMTSSLDHHGQQPTFIDTKPKHNIGGVKRSMSANGGTFIPVSTRTSIQQQHQSTNQRVMATSSNMMRAGPGGRSETTSLLGEKSVSAMASTTSPSYGAAQTDD